MMLSALLSFVWRKQMKNQTGYFETKRYRCLVYQEKQTDDLYLTICGYEKCAPAISSTRSGARAITCM